MVNLCIAFISISVWFINHFGGFWLLPVLIFSATVASACLLFTFTQLHELPHCSQADFFLGYSLYTLSTAARILLLKCKNQQFSQAKYINIVV